MSTTAARIEQFRTMAEANPNDELAFFSLGRAYAEAGEHAEAVAAFAKVIELNPKMSKAYQLLANAYFASSKHLDALTTLKAGVRIAHDRGDMMPRNDMLKTLKEHGVVMAEHEQTQQAAQPVGEGEVNCKRCGLVKPKMARQPFSHHTGKTIHDNICADCWREWIHMGTKVINELRLPLNDPQAQKVYDQHMMEFLHLK